MLSLVYSCKDNYPPPRIELCITGDDHKLLCNDMRQDEKGENYERDYPLNYLCTNTTDYNKLFAYTANLRKELIKCLNK